MANVPGCDTVARIESRDADQEVGEWQFDSPRGAFSIDLPGAECNGRRRWMDRQGGDQVVDEPLPPVFAFRRIGARRSILLFFPMPARRIVVAARETDSAGDETKSQKKVRLRPM